MAGTAFIATVLSFLSYADSSVTTNHNQKVKTQEASLCAPALGKILVFSKTAGYRHKSIEAGISAFKKLGCNYGLTIDTSEDASLFRADNLKQYDTVVFLNTTKDIFNRRQQNAFKKYIQAGGGYLGVHAATDTEYKWPWYNKLVGAYFNKHPKQQTGKLDIVDHNHSATEFLPDTWYKFDEWYNFKDINDDINVLIKIDETSYKGGTNGDNHPISWYHEFDGGRVFYTAMGHDKATYQNQKFIKHIVGGLKYTTQLPLKLHANMPEETRFERDILASDLSGPMELDELPNEGILFIERLGLIKLYNFKTRQVEMVGEIDVFNKNEDGLLGLAVDPNYEKNNWIYLYYSPAGDEAVQHLSRFTLVDRKLDLSSEKLMMKIPVIRKCCHSGGSLEFDKYGTLFIGVGDNTNPFKSNGFAPIDETRGRARFDSQRTAANTNSLNGKILRIIPNDDGTYSIPQGNLFQFGTPKTRPEIYTMGLRNPFRLSIDSKTNFLYWGDIGPDAGKAKKSRGPEGLAEFNQARAPGNWGWPYTRGNNKPYVDYDFERKRSGKPFNPNKLMNESVNNTGLKKLPKAQKSLIWYGYAESEEFPWLGKGGVNPMAGPVFHQSDFKPGVASFPAYFEDKLFVYEWMRDWIYVVALDENHEYLRAEPFMPSSKFSKPMDMIFASDGNLYVLEYGASWHKQNADARLNRISYISGNRKPLAKVSSKKLSSDSNNGKAPVTLMFSAKGSVDYDNDPISYQWRVNGKLLDETDEEIKHTFKSNGEHKVELTVIDSSGAKSSDNLAVLIGNDAPKITIKVSPNTPVFTKQREIDYEVIVTDEQDGSSADGSISADDIKVTFEYISAKDLAKANALGHKKNTTPLGQQLMDGSDCRACHGLSVKVNGPSYQEIAATYSSKDIDYLVKKVIEGGAGVWGQSPMSAHPQLKVKDVKTIVEYILTLDPNSEKNKGLPLSGELEFDQHNRKKAGGQYRLTATYKDKGINNNESTRFPTTEQIIFSAKNK